MERAACLPVGGTAGPPLSAVPSPRRQGLRGQLWAAERWQDEPPSPLPAVGARLTASLPCTSTGQGASALDTVLATVQAQCRTKQASRRLQQASNQRATLNQ